MLLVVVGADPGCIDGDGEVVVKVEWVGPRRGGGVVEWLRGFARSLSRTRGSSEMEFSEKS